MKNHKAVTVIGSGVSGLTTALCLLEAGYQVSIYTKALWPDTTSAVAAAIWFPYAAAPIDKVNNWSLTTYHRLAELAQQEGTGVSMIDFLVLSAPGRQEDWLQALPGNAVRAATEMELPSNYKKAYVAKVPLTDTSIYLEYLVRQIDKSGGQIIEKTVGHPDELNLEGMAYINCSGLGTKTLFGDPALYPVRGQVLSVSKNFEARSMVDSMHTGQLAYIIERERDFILGGTDAAHDANALPDDEDTRQIISRCNLLSPRIGQPELLAVKVGLRPKAKAIRCGWDDQWPVIHNYGHGGAGFTVSWGCADEVKQLVDAFFE
jgi:D-amino-acid oxidase